jgi:hypothetical protein
MIWAAGLVIYGLSFCCDIISGNFAPIKKVWVKTLFEF